MLRKYTTHRNDNESVHSEATEEQQEFRSSYGLHTLNAQVLLGATFSKLKQKRASIAHKLTA